MRTIKTLGLLGWVVNVLLVSNAIGLEYGQRYRESSEVSLSNVLINPEKFAEKRIAVWGVVGGYQEATFVFLTHEHMRWRDLSSAVRIEPSAKVKELRLGSEAWLNLYGLAVRLEGRLQVEKMGEEWNLLLLVEHVFVPDGDRQTGEKRKPTESIRK
jgi:hypothetical protein